MSKPSAPSIIRTITPVIVGQIAAYLATIGVILPDDVMAAVTVVLGFAFTTVYYIIVRWLEQRWPWIGVLLGYAAVPESYTKAPDREPKH